MLEEKVKISYVGMESSQSLKEYLLEKLEGKKKFLEEATSIDVFFKQSIHSKGVKEDFRLDINVALPNAPIRVEQSGGDMYANIDLAIDTLTRRIKRYRDKRAYWEGTVGWKVVEAEEALKSLTEQVEDDLDDYDYSDYVPGIATRKTIKNLEVLEEGEAIEMMELQGYNQFLFRNKGTDKITMIYKREQGGYGLVEPA
jgi:putative sigma-54 modulation protein